MIVEKKFDWFNIASQLKAISQAGKFYAKDSYELQRHEDIERIAAEIMAGYCDLEADDVLTMLQKDCGYPTPKVDCRGVVFQDEKILLVKEIADGLWTLPGGWCDVGMTPSENVAREVWEESGFEVNVDRLLAVYDRDRQGHTPPYPFNIYKMFFLCDITGGHAKTSNETSDVRFFSRDQIPDLSKGRTLAHQIELFFKMQTDPTIPVDFDRT